MFVTSSGVVDVCGVSGVSDGFSSDGVKVCGGSVTSVWGGVSVGVSGGGFVVLSVGGVVIVVPVSGVVDSVPDGALQPVKVIPSAIHISNVNILVFICFLRGFACCMQYCSNSNTVCQYPKRRKRRKNFSKGEQRGFIRARILTEKVFYCFGSIVYDIISIYNIILYSRSKLCLMIYWTGACT